MKKTAFYSIHESLGAKIVPFAGYFMPVQYEGVNAEHQAVREAAGLFDVSHMGEFFVSGPNAFELVQRITTNDVSKLVDGKIQYSCMPNHKGGIVDDLLVYRIDDQTYMLVVNASNMDKDREWIEKCNVNDAGFQDLSDDISLLALQGPHAMEIAQKLTKTPVVDMEYYTFKKIELAGVPDVLLSTTGYTGSGGCEIYFGNNNAEHIWNAIMEAGAEYGIKPAGLAARDTLRLEMGFCLYGNDISEETSPIEAGLGWITKFVPGNDFINREYIENHKTNGVYRRLRGFEMIDKGIPRQDYDICDAEGNIIGNVTSGTMAPSLKKGIGMGYVKNEFSAFNTEVFIKVREKLLKAKIVKLPFYQK